MRRRFREVTEIEEIREIRGDTNASTTSTNEPEKHTKTLNDVWERINQLFFYSDLASLTEEELKAMKHLPNDEFQVNNVVYYTDENGYIINSRSIFDDD
jgi:hypothetical protein